MNSKLTKLIGALSIAALASTAGCKSEGDSQPATSTEQGGGGGSCGGATTTEQGGAQKSCGGGTGGH